MCSDGHNSKLSAPLPLSVWFWNKCQQAALHIQTQDLSVWLFFSPRYLNTFKNLNLNSCRANKAVTRNTKNLPTTKLLPMQWTKTKMLEIEILTPVLKSEMTGGTKTPNITNLISSSKTCVPSCLCNARP